jgi:hypothetical protein
VDGLFTSDPTHYWRVRFTRSEYERVRVVWTP